ncbi:MAG: hypothetical protein AVDCRST_MAG64-1916 [uncultured Phycisphaerae bacterium]|uniref:DUF4178 domain-containing protein n=1 Tax=uncultured Phycisphaerae bacterium TaxID=904963 RepID=A0A6J4P9C6_9BACT|nr:MAG: hypothetical protein AVDCRST_MAG64-1916 [uncultured Phycisphaerae bacterium]
MAGTFHNPTPVRVGMKAKLIGRTYEVTGRLVVGMHEEGRRYDWQEFQLVAGDGSFLFLEFDEGRWRAMVPQTVARRMTPAEARTYRRGSRLTIDGRPGTVTEAASAVVQHVEGRFRSDVAPGDVSNYIDARVGTGELTVEWTEGGEVEYYRGQHLSRREIYNAFGLTDALRQVVQQEDRSEGLLRFAALAVVAGLAALLIWAMTGSTGRVIARGSVTLEAAGGGGSASAGGAGAGGGGAGGGGGNIVSPSGANIGMNLVTPPLPAAAASSAGQAGPFRLEAGTKNVFKKSGRARLRVSHDPG